MTPEIKQLQQLSGTGVLDKSRLENAYITFSTAFDAALANTPVIYPSITTVLTGVGPVTEFKWLGDVPTMEEWIGERKINKLRASEHRLTTKWYANGIELDYEDTANDKLGLVIPRIQDLASMGPRKLDALAIDRYVNGFAGTLGTTYDGQFLFDTDHTADSAGTGTSQSNLQAGAFSSTTFNQAWVKMTAFKGTNGEPLEITPDTVLAGYTNQLAIRTVLQQAFKATGESNMDLNQAKLILNARITGNHWFLLALAARIRAVLVGIEYAPQFAELMGWDQMHMFMHRTGYAGAHMKIGMAYGQWQNAVGSTG